MKFIGTINGWKEAPHCWRYFFLSPLRIRREPTLILYEGNLALQESPAVYSIQVLGVVLFVEINCGMRA